MPSGGVGASWLVTAPTPTNTGTIDTTASARYAEPPSDKPGGDRPNEHRHPQQRGGRADRRQRRDVRCSPADDPREHELGAPGILVGPHRAHSREQPEHGAEQRQQIRPLARRCTRPTVSRSYALP